ncbi:hypothetical protein Tco_0312309, partial [Tanacetum coccineum]
MGGFWVMIVFTSEGAKETFRSNVGIGSWFSQLLQASNSFFVDERVTWIDIEGIPLKVWSKNTFSRITSKWGELLDFDEQEDGYLRSKRVCIKTTLVENIYESFKVIIQGKTFWIRAKEVSGWMPDFEEDIDQDSKSDDELSNEGSFDENEGLRITPNVEGESDLEEVAETIFEKEQASVEVKEETDVDAQKNASKVLDMEGDNFGHKVQDVEQESVTKNNSPLNNYKNDTENAHDGVGSKSEDQMGDRRKGIWIESPILVKDEFLSYFASRFNKPPEYRLHINLNFPNKLSLEQQMVLEIEVTREEIKKAVWDCGVDKSPGPDGFTFGFYRRYWTFLENNMVEAVLYFFNHGQFPNGSNSS